jgi:single-strand DNA-binding protein
LNTITITGRVGQDPEVRFTPSGTAVAKISIADDYRVKGAKKTNWWTCVGWGELATKVIEPYVKKGDTISVSGSCQTTSWEKDGQKHYKTEVTIKDLMLIGRVGGAAPAGGGEGGAHTPDDDIPF